MKTHVRHLFLSAAAALAFALTPAVFAEDAPPPPAPPPAPAAKAAPAPAPQQQPATEPPAVAADTAAAVPAAPVQPAAAHPPARHKRHRPGNEVVHVGGDASLAQGQKADAVVAVLGSASSDGDVADSVVSVLGNTRVSGTVGDSAVAVGGNVSVNGKVGDVVAVFGNVELGPDAEVNEVVAVGGKVTRDPRAVVHGQVENVSFSGAFAELGWLQSWVVNCALYFRPLAFAPDLMWAWWIAIGFLVLYVLLAMLFPQSVNRGVATLEERPGYSTLAAVLTVICAPIVAVLLVLTGIGIAVVPFLAVGLLVATLFGKTVMLAWLGRRVAKLAGFVHPAPGVLIGGVILLLLYTVPVLGFVLYKLLGWIGLGVVVHLLAAGMKRPPAAVPPAPVLPPPPVLPPVSPAVAATAVPALAAATLPRAGFWIRTAALVLDLVLVGVLCATLGSVLVFGFRNHDGANLLPALAIYGAVMWKLKGTTVGGIICGLKVVRLDDRPVDWGTAVVRALGCFLSFVVLGLGFLWVGFDDQRQSWHDKIAGTTVVRMPKGASLV